MKKRYLALLSVMAVLAFTSIALASGTTHKPEAHKSTRPDVCKVHKHPATEQRALAHVVFSNRHWRRAHVGHGRLVEVGKLRHCVKPKTRSKMRAEWSKEKLRFGRYRRLRQIAPYYGHGEWWAIPWPIVECESLSSGLWTAANPSGAVGPYQLLGHGAPYPAYTWRDKMENHEIAGELYAEEGTSPWVSSEGCWG